METRVSRHNYDNDGDIDFSRKAKNADLYKQDYTGENLVVPKVSNGRELNEDEFQKIINLNQTRSMKVITEDDMVQFDIKRNKKKSIDEDKVYDINTVLESAKNRRKIEDDSKYVVPDFSEYKPANEKDVNDNDDLLSDLMGNDNTIVTKAINNDTLVEDEITVNGTKIDNSFYSKSLKFRKKDFNFDEEDDEENDNYNKKSKSQVVITVIIVVLLVAAVILGILVLGKIKF